MDTYSSNIDDKGSRIDDDYHKKANELLVLAYSKLCELKKCSSQSDKTYIDYKKYYTGMGFDVYIETFKDYINNNQIIYDMVKTFIANITYKKEEGTDYLIFTLHDAVDRIVRVRKYNQGDTSKPSDYCKARDVFIKILQFIKQNVSDFESGFVLFRYSRFSGLLASSRTCTTLAEKYNLDPLQTVENEKTNSVLYTGAGGSKSRRTRRRKHSRKSHHKHARKTHHNRKHHSRAARKHKKYSRRR